MATAHCGTVSDSKYPPFVLSEYVPTSLITGSHDVPPTAQTIKTAKVGADIISSVGTPIAGVSSGQNTPPPLKRRLVSPSSEQRTHPIAKKLAFSDLVTEPLSVPKIDPIVEMMGTIPFTLLATSTIPQNHVPFLETFVRKSLPGVLHAALQVHAVIKCIPESSIIPGLSIKCREEGLGGAIEVCVRHLVQVGGVKEVYRQVYLLGSKCGQVFAYAKPKKESAPSQRGSREIWLSEMRHEIRMSRSLPPSSSLMPMQEEIYRKDCKRLKGLIMPWCEKGDLYTYLQTHRFQEPFRVLLARAIADGLQVIHANKKCHLDLKSGNILLQGNDHPLIGDFGRMYEQGKVLRFPISTYYCLAPEQIAEYVAVDPSADMWAFGLILLEIVHGIQANLYVPLSKATRQDDFNTPAVYPILKAAWMDTRQKIFASLHDQWPIDRLIKRLLSEDPKLRPTAQEVIGEIDAINAGFLAQANALLRKMYGEPK